MRNGVLSPECSDSVRLCSQYANERVAIKTPIENALKSKTKTGIIAISAVSLVAGYTKLFALKLNRTGSKEFKIQSTEG